MVTSDVTYREASRHLLSQAHAELDAGDLRQASEKAWGAAAQIVKATAELRGWDHHSHRGLLVTVDRLTDEVGDQEIHDLFMFASGLHMNFYENTFGANRVARNLVRTEEFILKLDVILDAPTPSIE
jgi:uncharacterized protein (UPF0332 family)